MGRSSNETFDIIKIPFIAFGIMQISITITGSSIGIGVIFLRIEQDLMLFSHLYGGLAYACIGRADTMSLKEYHDVLYILLFFP